MKKVNSVHAPLPRLSDFTRPSVSLNKEIVAATTAETLGDLFDTSYNARIGVLAKTTQEVDRLVKFAEKMLQLIPKEKMPYINFLIVDNRMDLGGEVFASHKQRKNEPNVQQSEEFKKNAAIFLSQVMQKACSNYARFKDKNWNKDELRNELEKMKEIIFRTIANKNDNIKKPEKPLLFSKKQQVVSPTPTIGNLVKGISVEDLEKNDRAKLMFTGTRAREDSLPADLVKNALADDGKLYSFLDLLAADGYETDNLEQFEEQVILKLEALKEHILHQFNPVFNELNAVRKRLRHLTEQSNKLKDEKKSIIKETT